MGGGDAERALTAVGIRIDVSNALSHRAPRVPGSRGSCDQRHAVAGL